VSDVPACEDLLAAAHKELAVLDDNPFTWGPRSRHVLLRALSAAEAEIVALRAIVGPG